MVVDIRGLAKRHNFVTRYKIYNVLSTMEGSPVVYEDDITSTLFLDNNLYDWVKR